MARHLTDREKKKIIADYAELGSCNAVAKKHKRSWTTIKQVVENNSVYPALFLFFEHE